MVSNPRSPAAATISRKQTFLLCREVRAPWPTQRASRDGNPRRAEQQSKETRERERNLRQRAIVIFLICSQ